VDTQDLKAKIYDSRRFIRYLAMLQRRWNSQLGSRTLAFSAEGDLVICALWLPWNKERTSTKLHFRATFHLRHSQKDGRLWLSPSRQEDGNPWILTPCEGGTFFMKKYRSTMGALFFRGADELASELGERR
jgi:hypothetical protein